MKLSVVIPSLDEAESIGACVASARADGVEVVVVDGGSRDDSVVAARRAGARVLSAAPGRARQLAAGLEACGGDVVLFLHADSRLPDGWSDAVRDALCDPRVVGGSFALRFDARTPGLRWIERGAALRRWLLGLPYGDQGIFSRRTVLEAIGGVPQAPLMEDLDLVARLREQGRLARLGAPVVTSARRYLTGGVGRMMLRNWGALLAWRLGLPRQAVARWYRG